MKLWEKYPHGWMTMETYRKWGGCCRESTFPSHTIPSYSHSIPTLHIRNSSTLFRSHTVSFRLYTNPDYISCTLDPLSYSPLLICAHPNSSVSTHTIMLLSFSIILLMTCECDRYLDILHRYLNRITLLRLSLFVPILCLTVSGMPGTIKHLYVHLKFDRAVSISSFYLQISKSSVALTVQHTVQHFNYSSDSLGSSMHQLSKLLHQSSSTGSIRSSIPCLEEGPVNLSIILLLILSC